MTEQYGRELPADCRCRQLLQFEREWVLTTNVTFLTTNVYKDSKLTTRDDKRLHIFLTGAHCGASAIVARMR